MVFLPRIMRLQLAKSMVSIKFKNTLTEGIKEFFTKIGMGKTSGADINVKKKVGAQLLNYIIDGSPRESITPPLLYSALRDSASVFVGNILVKANGAEANRNYSDSITTITVGFSAVYAARMHEHMVPATEPDPKLKIIFNPSERSKGAGGGGKYVERHLNADGKALIKLYSDFLKEEIE